MARSILASSSPISSMRSSMSATAPAPPPPLQDGKMPFFPATGTNEAPNPATFVKALDPPKYGFDRYVEQHLANAGGRTLKGKGSKGNIYTSGHFAGKTQGQAIEMMRAAYAGMSDEARAPFEAGANGRDVMSATEQATLARHDLARGVEAGGGMSQGSPVTGGSVATPQSPAGSGPAPIAVTTSRPPAGTTIGLDGRSYAPTTPQPRASGGIFEQTANGKVRAERQADGTIKRTLNGASVDAQGKPLIAAAPASAATTSVPAPAIPMPRSIETTPAGRAGDVISGAERAGKTLANDRLRQDLTDSYNRGKALMDQAALAATFEPQPTGSSIQPKAISATPSAVSTPKPAATTTVTATPTATPAVAQAGMSMAKNKIKRIGAAASRDFGY